MIITYSYVVFEGLLQNNPTVEDESRLQLKHSPLLTSEYEGQAALRDKYVIQDQIQPVCTRKVTHQLQNNLQITRLKDKNMNI